MDKASDRRELYLRELTSHLGFAMWQVQEVEVALRDLLLLKKYFKKGVAKSAWDQTTKKVSKLSFGQLLTEVRAADIVEDSLADALQELVGRRNWLVHHSRADTRGVMTNALLYESLTRHCVEVVTRALELQRAVSEESLAFIEASNPDREAIAKALAGTMEAWGLNELMEETVAEAALADPVVVSRLKLALSLLGYEDVHLFRVDSSERSLSGRLACHLQNVFEELHVDVEYNRHGRSPKQLSLSEECANKKDEQGLSLVYPDIIVHRRGSDDFNLLAIEVKKSSNSRGRECDDTRIHAYRTQLGYRHAVRVELETADKLRCGSYSLKWAEGPFAG